MKSFILLLLIFVFSCEEKNSNLKLNKEEEFIDINLDGISSDTLDGTQFIAVVKDVNYFPNYSDLSEDELELTNSLFKEALENYNKKTNQKLDTRYYKRQYFPFINEMGDKIVMINCLCMVFSPEGWKHEYIQVNDGGECFFKIEINLTKQTYSEVYVNGLA